MATTIEQQVAMDEALFPSTQRCPFFKAFLVTADVLEIYMQEFWATAYVHQQSIRFKINNKKLIVSLESFREILHICPRIHGQSFDELPFEEEILDFIRFLRHSATIRTLTDISINKLYQPWRSFAAIINKCLTGKSSGYDREAVPKPKAIAKRKRSDSDTSITPPATTTPKQTIAVTPRLTAAAKGKQTTKSLPALSEPSDSGTDEGTGLKLRVSDVPTDESKEELSWNSSDDEGADDQVKDGDDDEGDEEDESDEGEEDADEDKDGDERDDDEVNQETEKYDEQDDAEGGGDDEEEGESDKEDDNEETREEESFDPIPKTPEGSEDEGDDKQTRLLKPSLTFRSVNAQLEAEVLTRSSHSSRTSYAIAADLSKMELKKILIEKMEGNKSIQRLDKQRNLYKALVDAYEPDKIILDSYEETIILKRRRDDEDDQDKGPSAGSDRGSKRQREGKEPESASGPLETATKSAGMSTTRFKPRQASHPEWFSQLKKPPTLDRDWNKTLPAVQGSTQTWISKLEKQADSRSSFNKLLDTPLDFSNFIMNQLRFDRLTPELLAGPTFELMKGSYTSLIELEYHLEEVYKATTDQLDWVNPEDSEDIQCAGSDHGHYQEAACAHHEEKVMHDCIQLDHVVDSHDDYMSDSNIILCDQYVKDNKSLTHHGTQKNSLIAELATYREQVELYERRAKFELTEREKKINEQLRLVISNRNFKEETLKRELHSTKLQLASTMNHNKSMVEDVSFLKKDFKQKENKYLADFLNIKTLKEKVEDKLIKQDQSLQTVHMLCRLRPNSNELKRVAIGYKNPLCLTRAKQVQPALYNGYEIIKDNHTPAIVYNSEDTIEIAKITRKKMNDKMNDPECVTRKVKIAPHDYSKENLLATFTPQKQLTPK
nr:hypothetical protein [Tanacetum cinerariifolium]